MNVIYPPPCPTPCEEHQPWEKIRKKKVRKRGDVKEKDKMDGKKIKVIGKCKLYAKCEEIIAKSVQKSIYHIV
jgi:hypothetical protein